MFMYLWPYLHVWWMSINYFELFCSDPGQCCVRVYLSCASAERDIHNNIIWIRPIFTGGSHKNLAWFHPKISTSLFSHTCTHRWNRLVFTQCYNSTGQDCRHNSDRFRVSRGQILEASCVCSQSYGQAWKKCLFPCKLSKISLQQDRFPSSVRWFPLCISLFFPSKSQDFPARSFPFCLFFPGLVMGNVAYFDKHSVWIKVCKIAYTSSDKVNVLFLWYRKHSQY